MLKYNKSHFGGVAVREELKAIWIETFKEVEEGQPNHFVEIKPGTGILGQSQN